MPVAVHEGTAEKFQYILLWISDCVLLPYYFNLSIAFYVSKKKHLRINKQNFITLRTFKQGTAIALVDPFIDMHSVILTSI